MSDDVNVKFGADTGEATSAITELREMLRGFSAPIQGIRANLGELAEAFVAAFAVEKVAEFFEKMAQLGTQTERTAAMLGISTEQVGEFSAMAELTGTSTEGMTTTLERLAMSLQRAKEGTGPAAAGFKALGLDAKEMAGLKTEEVLAKISDKFAGLDDGLNKTAIAMAILGRGGAQMIPLLDRGSVGMAELGEVAHRTGTALDEGITKTFTSMHETFVEFGLAIKGIGITLANAFGPAVTAIAGALADLIEWFNQTIQTGGTFKGLLDLLVIAANSVATGIMAVVFAIEAVVQTVDLAMREIRDIVHGNLGAAQKDFETFQSSMMTSAESMMQRLDALWGEHGSGEKKKKKPPPPMDLSGGDPNEVAQKEMDGEIKVLEQGLALKKMILEQEFNQHKITKSQELASLQDYTDDAYNDERALLDKELALWGQGTKQYQEVINKRNELDAKYALESQKITGESVAAQQKQYQDMANTIEGAFNSQLRGLLAGTTSWGTAFKNIMGDLVIKFIESVEKMAVEWVIGEAMKTTATTTGVAARTTAEAAGAAAGSAVTMASVVRSIMSSAAQTFAGVTAFLSPVMGPAATGPAAASEAMVAAQAGAAYAQGTPWVPADGMAMLHRGEAVIPASVNAAGIYGGSDGGGGGDSHIHFHGGVNDAQSLARFWKQNAANISSALSKHSAVNPA